MLALATIEAIAQTPGPSARAADDSRDAQSYKASTSTDYVIGIGDVLAINVWKDADLSKTMPVRPDGKISLPVIGDIAVAGLTTGELQERLVTKLGPYVRNPQVNVIIEQIRSRTFNVMGKVSKPGSFDLIKPTSLLDAIALAGGFTEYARVSHIHVLRTLPDGSQTVIPFNYKALIKGKRPADNLAIQPGDTVVVP